jgi:hypothetical protein
MSYKKRLIEERILELFQYYPVVAVLGARQVGKTTLIENLYKDQIKTIVFDPVIDLYNARNDPDFFLQNLSCPVFFDEIQYAPEILNSIKRKVDSLKKNGLYLLSGSQQLSVLKNISESLAGRVAIINLLPMNRQEKTSSMNQSFIMSWLNLKRPDIDQDSSYNAIPVFPHIFRGGYPKLIDFPDHLISGYFESYLQTYIERDVRRVSNIGSLQTFGNFIGLLSAKTACEINYNELGRELGVERKTALSWGEIAQATFQWFSIPPFSRNPIKKIAGKSKGYFSDTGFICYLQRISVPEVIAAHPLKGQLFETYVVLELLKSIQAMAIKPNFYHFRTYSGAEVDLILELNGMLFPIEIKAKSNPSKKDIKGFQSLKKCFPQENYYLNLLICSIEKPQMISEDVYAIPWWMI